jgi:hypothetical protein
MLVLPDEAAEREHYGIEGRSAQAVMPELLRLTLRRGGALAAELAASDGCSKSPGNVSTRFQPRA